MTKTKIFPSLLSADFGKLNSEIASVESFSDGLHFDVMDGHFVHPITAGAIVLSKLKTSLPIEAHLMVSNPDKLIPDFIKAGSSAISIHIEASKDLTRDLQTIRDAGRQAGIAINPKTDVSTLEPYLEQADYVLIMSVEPGYSGQEFIESSLDKIKTLRQNHPNLTIVVDGGIDSATGPKAVKAGANILVAGSFIFSALDREEAIGKLRMTMFH